MGSLDNTVRPSTEIKAYPITDSFNNQHILNHYLSLLRPNLPVSLPLYRRLQSGHYFDASVILSNIPLNTSLPLPTTSASSTETPWLVAFVDRSCRPETEVWFHGSWETSPSHQSYPPGTDELIRNVVQTMSHLPVPPSIHAQPLPSPSSSTADDVNDTSVDTVGVSRAEYGGHMSDPNIMLWGATHEKTCPLLQRLGVVAEKFKSGLIPNFTFVWDIETLPARDLPEGLRWGKLRREHLGLVRSRTQIPRQERTLVRLPNLGIFPVATEKEPEPAPVAWVFSGLDASLTTLHVEEAWRGKGLAKTITTKLFHDTMEGYWEEGLTKMGHGYVIVGNKQSEGMCRSLGGKSEWECFWLRLDLGAI